MSKTIQDPNFAQQDEMSASGNEQRKHRSFSNPLYPSDSLTSCRAFISDVKSRKQGEDTLYFARLGLIQGRELNGDEYKSKVGNNVDLLVQKGDPPALPGRHA
ncbi:hypothetical protein [uncultured Microbulbifer sp.]|uniref:hypothetical protein n=1 Tax=uncultured Microbulbifer sp. TaxID=348147 RepID=UPI002619CEC2|nr:hypothetical protein [uncultured Microbulbifer sp.]